MNKQQLASKIWAAANEMRSKIEASEYKDYDYHAKDVLTYHTRIGKQRYRLGNESVIESLKNKNHADRVKIRAAVLW